MCTNFLLDGGSTENSYGTWALLEDTSFDVKVLLAICSAPLSRDVVEGMLRLLVGGGGDVSISAVRLRHFILVDAQKRDGAADAAAGKNASRISVEDSTLQGCSVHSL